jgi:hypothetical protein
MRPCKWEAHGVAPRRRACDRLRMCPATPAPDAPGSAQPAPARAHRKTALALVLAASLLAFFGIFAVWLNRQALNTNNWTDTSSKLLEDDAIRAQVAAFLVDQIYLNVDVQGEISSALPPRAAPLSGPIAGALREVAERSANQLLERPRAQALWEQANRQAHRQLLQVVNGGGNVVSTQGGDVTLDLKTLLDETEKRVGVGGRIQKKLPPDAAQIRILRSDQLELAQDGAHALKTLAIVLPALAILLYALAVYLARGWRREALRAVGFGLAIAGATVLLARSVSGNAIVDSLTSTESVRPAAHDAWSISTTLLKQAAAATLAYGIVVFLAAWLSGPTRLAVSARRGLAPFLREPRFAWGGLAVIVLLLLAWGPTPATKKALPALILIGLLVLGTEVLRRQTAREYPDASLAEVSHRWQTRVSDLVGRGPQPTGPSAPESSVDQLERLTKLRDAGAVDEVEFQQEKRKILGGGHVTPGASR